MVSGGNGIGGSISVSLMMIREGRVFYLYNQRTTQPRYLIVRHHHHPAVITLTGWLHVAQDHPPRLLLVLTLAAGSYVRLRTSGIVDSRKIISSHN